MVHVTDGKVKRGSSSLPFYCSKKVTSWFRFNRWGYSLHILLEGASKSHWDKELIDIFAICCIPMKKDYNKILLVKFYKPLKSIKIRNKSRILLLQLLFNIILRGQTNPVIINFSAYHVLGPFWRALHILTYLSLITTLGGRYYFTHLVDEKAGAWWSYVNFPNLYS